MKCVPISQHLSWDHQRSSSWNDPWNLAVLNHQCVGTLKPILKFRVFWDVAPCSHVELDRRFRGAYDLNRHDDADSTHLWNVCQLQRDYTALHPRRLLNSYSPPWEPEISHKTDLTFKAFRRTFANEVSDNNLQMRQDCVWVSGKSLPQFRIGDGVIVIDEYAIDK
jgi:hypothetical protein